MRYLSAKTGLREPFFPIFGGGQVFLAQKPPCRVRHHAIHDGKGSVSRGCRRYWYVGLEQRHELCHAFYTAWEVTCHNRNRLARRAYVVETDRDFAARGYPG